MPGVDGFSVPSSKKATKRKLITKKLTVGGSSQNVHTDPRTGKRSIRTFCLKDFDVGKKLGVGKFGKVYLAREKRKKYICAIKVLFLDRLQQHQVEHTLRREVEIMANVRHPNLIRLFGYFYDAKRFYFILEYAVGGEIFDHLRDEERFTEKKSARYIKDLASALAYLHSKNIIHRDIKPENLLLDGEGRIRLSDFGWSVHTPGRQKRYTICGTVEYLAPEMIEKKPHKHSVDTWSLGVLCYEFLVGRSPFESNDQKSIFKKIKKGQFKFPDFLSSLARTFITALLQKRPEDRILLTDVPFHPFITKYCGEPKSTDN